MTKIGNKNNERSDAGASEGGQPPIDRQHLSEFAMGDPALEHRFLRLFLEHAHADLKRMGDAAVHDFRKAAHSLKSSASSIGAWAVVRHLEQIMEMEDHLVDRCRDKILAELSCHVDDVMRHIRQIIDDD